MHTQGVKKMEKAPLKILVTGATGQIGYALVPMIARGLMLGPNQPIILHLLGPDRAFEALKGLKMELVDSAFPLLKGIIATSDVVEACKGVNIAIMVAGVPCKEGMQRKDVLPMNVSIFKSHGSALDQHAAPNCKLSEHLKVPVTDVKNVIIWGNHSVMQYPDANYATVTTTDGEKPIQEVMLDEQWLQSRFVTIVQHRGDNVLKVRKKSSALSAASATCDHVRDWILGTPKGTWVSMGIYSDGSYGIQPGLMYSFPVTCQNEEWSIVQELNIDEFSREKMDASAEELMMEKSAAYSCLTR